MARRAIVAMATRNPVTNRLFWLTAIALGGAALVGGVAYASSRGGPSAPAPGTAVVPAAVGGYQVQLAVIIASGTIKASYALSDVDGNARSPKFVAALTVFQKWIDSGGASGIGWTAGPINDQGVLDLETSTALGWTSAHVAPQAAQSVISTIQGSSVGPSFNAIRSQQPVGDVDPNRPMVSLYLAKMIGSVWRIITTDLAWGYQDIMQQPLCNAAQAMNYMVRAGIAALKPPYVGGIYVVAQTSLPLATVVYDEGCGYQFPST